MPKGTNCPNCGAVYEIDKNKCPYCGSSYYDMSAVDFTNREPFYLKIKTELNGQNVYITQLVVPSLDSMEFSTESTYAYDGRGHKVSSFISSQTFQANVSFTAIADKNNNMIQVEMAR